MNNSRKDLTMTDHKDFLKTTILFLCTGNSCRSQMAEGWARHIWRDRLQVCSAGTAAKGLDPRAVRVMREAGVDISGHRSKNIGDLGDLSFDYVITVCDNAKENCPWFPARVKLMHHSFVDPPRLAEGIADPEKAMEPYRHVRDEIRQFVETLPDILNLDL